MPSLTLKKIPEDTMVRLRWLAEKERRSLNQQAILLLERALDEKRPNFTEAYKAFVQDHGPSPLDDASFNDVFEGLRSRELGRPSPIAEDEADR